MATEIVLPAGYSIRIDYDASHAPLSLGVSVFLDGEPVGETRVSPRDARDGELQAKVDAITGRGAGRR
jgi:hypothetical protein